VNEQIPFLQQVLPWLPLAGLALLLLLCLPFTGIQRLILEVYSLVLRLAMLGLIGAAAYLWFFPEDLPAGAADALNYSPQLKALLPEPGTHNFGVCAAALAAAVLLPALAVLDVSRNLAGWRMRRIRVLTSRPVVVEGPAGPAPVIGRTVRRVDRRAAADVLADAGSRRPFRAPDR
jgi:hypothetical protein